jgi:hypothetical protein
MKTILLNRDEFKQQVFARDNNKCILCRKDAVDAHHIIDRSFFVDQGYYIDNGVSLCGDCHILAEQTVVSCQELRDKAGIVDAIYPEYLGLNEFVIDYDKWANPVLKRGKRLKGYFFDQDNVQKMLKAGNVLHTFEKDREMIVEKYPRTYHCEWTMSTDSDDRIAKNINNLLDREIVITEKIDGENTSESEIGIFARSRIAPTKNPWSSWMKPKWEMIKNDLKSFDLELCGENMYAEHSILYSGINEHLYIFGARNTKHDVFLSWEETEYFAEMFDFKTVPVLFKGKMNSVIDIKNWSLNEIKTPSILNDSNFWITPKEGFVYRIADEFPNDMFFNSVFKMVRKGHVKTDEHWSRNWRRSYLNYELKNMNIEKIKSHYTDKLALLDLNISV